MTPILWFLNRGDPAMRQTFTALPEQRSAAVYLPRPDRLGVYVPRLAAVRVRAEFGAEALWLQAVPFAIAHIGKPEIETLSTIFGGFAFGWVAWRTRSFVYPFLIHWYIATLTYIGRWRGLRLM